MDWNGAGAPGWSERAVANLEASVKNGAIGLKIFKSLGMQSRKADGSRLKVDDPILKPVWDLCARLDIPVLIHTAEPQEFFSPLDYQNQRWLELALFRDRRHYMEGEPTFEELMGERDRLFLANPGTRFINAHFGWYGNDLARAARFLDDRPNVVMDLSAVLYDFGRQPRATREFFIRYQDRILFGKDSYVPSEFPYYSRVFETRTSTSTTTATTTRSGSSTGSTCPTSSCVRCTLPECAARRTRPATDGMAVGKVGGPPGDLIGYAVDVQKPPRKPARPSGTRRSSGRTLADTAYARLRENIVTLRLAPGAALTEVELCRRLGISRTPVRAALARLQQEGLVAGQPDGRVGPRGRWRRSPASDMRELFLMVGALDGVAARLAAELPDARRRAVAHAAEAINARLRALSGHSDASRHPDLAQELDVRFHRCYEQAASGPRLLAKLVALQARRERYVRVYTEALVHTHSVQESLDEHGAIIAGDYARATPTRPNATPLFNYRNALARYWRIVAHPRRAEELGTGRRLQS